MFGTADSPTVLANAIWLRDGDGCLVFASAADAQAVGCAVQVVAFPLVDGPWGWSELRRFCEAVRRQAVEPASKIYLEADGAIAASLLTSQVSKVLILCASHTHGSKDTANFQAD